ncbi:MAG TPA: hypothetical protein VFI43_01845 [Nitrosospira sp.]|nr:hypothetical protein [Nitrosospira sp.]
MNIAKVLFLILAFGLSVALPVQATTLKVLQDIGSPNSVQFLQNDWNPADGDTHWQTVAPDSMSVATDPSVLDFNGAIVAGTFVVGDDPWETVSIKSNAGQQFDLRKTQEFQLLARPQYVTANPYITVVLRLTMQDGSIWDQPKVLANNVWQKGAFPVQDGSFTRVEWGPEGIFDLGKVASWEVILVDLPPSSSHRMDFRAMQMKGNYDAPAGTDVAEPFGVDFFNGDENILFRRADWNPSDGDTDWLYHVRSTPIYYVPYGFLRALYRYGGDAWETVSIRKEAQTYFDLSANQDRQIVALVDAGLNPDPNALILSLTMEDGSVWQQGRPVDVVRKTALRHYTHAGDIVLPYRFPLDPNGKGWTMAAWAPPGSFNLNRVKAWELYFNNLEQGSHGVVLSTVDGTTASSLVRADNTLSAGGQAQWLDTSFASDGVVANINSAGGITDNLSIASKNPVGPLGLGFNLEVTTSYVNASPDALVFKLTASDGKVWQQAFDLPQPGRSVLRIYTSCPSTYPQMVRPDPDDLRCKGILGSFYGINPADISKWEIILNRPAAGQHQVKVNLLSTID